MMFKKALLVIPFLALIFSSSHVLALGLKGDIQMQGAITVKESNYKNILSLDPALLNALATLCDKDNRLMTNQDCSQIRKIIMAVPENKEIQK